MTNDVKDNLFVLVKSLTKSEKRQFKLFVGRMHSNEDSKFLNLFNQLEKMDNYDEKIILEKGIVSKQQLSNLKAHLYKQILISLRLTPVHKNIRLKIRSQIDFATILYQKGLYKQSLKALEKAKNIAYKYDEKNSAYEIVEFEKLIESQYITRSMSNRTKELTTQSDYLRKQNDISSRLSNISLKLYEKLIKVGYVKSDEDYKKLTKFFYSRMPKIKIDNLGFKEQILYYKAWVWYSLITQDFLSSYKYASKWVAMFEKNPEMINIHPVFYLKGTNYLLEALPLIKYPVKFKKTLIQLINNIESNDFQKNQNTSSLSFLYKYNNLFNLYALEGNFEESLNIIPDVLEGIKKNKDLIDPTHIMLLYYKIGCMYFALDDYEKCIVYLDKIIKDKNVKMREDLQCFTRILNLMAHYEAGYDYHLDKIIRDTYKYLLKMNDLHEVQKALLKYVRSLENIYPHDIKDSLKSLYKELKKFEDDPYEKRSFLYLDVLSYLESKIKAKPLRHIIREKAISLNRKEKQSIKHS